MVTDLKKMTLLYVNWKANIQTLVLDIVILYSSNFFHTQYGQEKTRKSLKSWLLSNAVISMFS